MTQRYFRHHGPRTDLGQGFYPNRLSTHRPALLNAMNTLTGSLVSALVFREIASRGGSQIGTSSIDPLIAELERAVEADVLGHCRAEAEAVLEWIEFPPQGAENNEIPELRVMREGEVNSRLKLAQMALDEGLDLELQFYDPDTKRWPQRRVTPLRVEHEDKVIVVDNGTSELMIDGEDIRWLMPVVRRGKPKTKPPADVLTFPGGES